MKFHEYVENQMKKTGERKTACLKRLAKKSGLSLLTLQKVEGGGRLVRYDKAIKLRDLTGGLVSIQEICEERK